MNVSGRKNTASNEDEKSVEQTESSAPQLAATSRHEQTEKKHFAILGQNSYESPRKFVAWGNTPQARQVTA